MTPRIAILIPARFASSRFPGKPLVPLKNRFMIQYVWDNCSSLIQSTEFQCEVFVVTDDQRIEDAVLGFGGKVLRVDDDVISGSLRIQLAYERFLANQGFDLIVNVQGDEPLLRADELKQLILKHLGSSFDIMTMVKKQMSFDEEFQNPNRVKAVVSETTRQCFYFSRQAIPYKRDLPKDPNEYWYLHIGVYSYRPKALIQFAASPETRLENLEKLEQLRALEIGLTIGAMETKSVLIGVDTPEDVKKVEEVLNGRS